MDYKLRISGFNEESIVDGEGFRFVIFVQGCIHDCPNCHNPETHPLNSGREMSISEIESMILENKLLNGVTFSGGEPFLQPLPLTVLGKKLKESGLNITTYTGFTYEQLLEMAQKNPEIKALLNVTDTLIDGPYIHELQDLSLKFRGSSNQRIIDLSKVCE